MLPDRFGYKMLPKPPRLMPELVWHFLYHKGFQTNESLDRLFQPSLSQLKDPLSLKDMDQAVERLIKAYQQNESILLYADFDMDGTPGLALLLDGLQRLGFTKLRYHQPLRLKDGYGFHWLAVKRHQQENDISLVVTVDVGITDVETVACCHQAGIDVIITDHHLPKEILPSAYAVVNPNQPLCSSGLNHLCGTGVAFYLVLALRRKMKELGLLTLDFNPKVLLDCFAIGTIADMVPMIDENWVLTKHGLVQLAISQRAGLFELLSRLNLAGKNLTSQDVGYRFVPKLNALSRMENGLLPIDLFLVKESKQAKKLVDEMLTINQQRKQMQQTAEDEALIQYQERRQQGYAWVWSKNFHKGVVGLVATKLSQTLGVPAFVGSETDEGNIMASGRLPDGSSLNLVDILASCKDHLLRFGGHAAAAGFELEVNQAEELNRALNILVPPLHEAIPHPVMVSSSSMEIILPDLTMDTFRWLEALEPFGIGFEKPVLMLKQVQLKSVRIMAGKHFKLKIEQMGVQQEALWFFPPGDHAFWMLEPSEVQSLDLVVEAQMNEFMGKKRPQLIVQKLTYKSVLVQSDAEADHG